MEKRQTTQKKTRTQPKGRVNKVKNVRRERKHNAKDSRTRDPATKEAYAVAKQLAKAEGARGVDSRMGAVEAPIAGGNVTLRQQDGSVNIQALTNIQTISNIALGAILDAVNKGWFTQTDSFNGTSGPEIAYNAWIYLTQSFINTMMGTYPTLQSAPDWFWHLSDALKPKDVPFKTAAATYSWMIQNYDPSSGPPQLPTLLPYDDFNAFVFGNLSTSVLVNGFATLIPVLFNQDIADRAIQALFGFYPDTGMTKRVPCASTDYLKMDTSAFAACYSEMGSDQNNLTPNGFVTSLLSETKIRCPILAKFAFYGNGDLRGFQEEKRAGGGGQYLIPRVMEFTSVSQFSNKCNVNIKYYNFDEYFEILSLAVSKAMTILQTGGLNTNAPTSCPLTSLDVQLLLRQAMLPNFCNHMSQSLVLDPYTIRMVPFSVASNGFSDQVGSGMRLPLFLTEAIRAARRRVIIPKRDWPNYQIDHVPVLGRPANLPQLGNYSYTVGTNTFLTYAVNPSQQDFRLVDLVAFPPNSGATYFTATGRPYMTMLEEWNKYITQIENALAGTAHLGTEQGIRALWSNPTTQMNKLLDFGSLIVTSGRNSNGVSSPPPKRVPKTTGPVPGVGVPKEEKKPPKREQIKIGTPTITADHVSIVPDVGLYTSQARTATVSSVPILSSVWKYSRLVPSPYVADTLQLEEYLSRLQTNYGEGFRYNYGQDSKYNILGNDEEVTTISVFSAHEEAADLCVRSPIGGGSEIEAELMELAKTGRGGFFTNIAGFLAEDVFGIKGAKNIAGAVGQALGI
jgi:hypothetical protein